jgi:hypothetical protein
MTPEIYFHVIYKSGLARRVDIPKTNISFDLIVPINQRLKRKPPDSGGSFGRRARLQTYPFCVTDAQRATLPRPPPQIYCIGE